AGHQAAGGQGHQGRQGRSVTDWATAQRCAGRAAAGHRAVAGAEGAPARGTAEARRRPAQDPRGRAHRQEARGARLVTRAPLGLVACALFAAAVGAQERLRVSATTFTVQLGSPARVDLVVEGRSGSPEAPKVPVVPGLSVRVAGPNTQSFTS